ncbi:hypothetical protein SAY86_022587 [Trapa natans]|uniref:Uncharacterized protein n=1 Tax=Trapa natans TaxID=22666 RepID=A0AAN7R746_TRANT|nr:hypothetical protein SAY86_022587 [Trapa natans]
MGGCASRPKDFDLAPETIPREAPNSPVKAEPEAVTRDKNDNGEAEMAEAKPKNSEEAEVKTVTDDKAVVVEDKAPITEEKMEVATANTEKSEADKKEEHKEENEADKEDKKEAPPTAAA